jgi:hypothetical protein
MSFDEMYDEMLHDEFSARGKHQAQAAAAEPELSESTSRGRHAAADEPAAERPRGFQRYRTAGLVGAGGLACAAAGAFLGGLGGYFTIAPAAAHALAAPTVTQDLPLAQAVGQGSHSSAGANGTSAVVAAAFSKASGSLTQGIAPFATLTTQPLGNLPVGSLPGLGGTGTGGSGSGGGSIGNGTVGGGSGGGGGGGGGLTGCAAGSTGLDLNCILTGLTSTLTNLGSLTGGGSPTTLLDGLDGVVTDVTGTLQNLTSLLPIASLPLPTGGIPTMVLAGGSGGGPVTSAPATTGGGSSNPVVSALAPVLNTVGSVTGALGSGTSIPSLPLPTTTGVTVPGVTPAGTTSTTTGGGSTTLNVPLPVSVPLNTPTITIGGLSVGVSSSGSTSGLTLTLP